MPIGTVIFRDGTTVLGTAQLNAAGQATLAVSLGVGTHALTASFAGTAAFAGSTSAAVAVTVNRAATTVALRSSVNPAVTGQAVTFTATVAAVAPGAGTPTGTVTFFVGTKRGGGGRRSMPTARRVHDAASRPQGPVHHPAVYSGDAELRRQLPIPHRAGQRVSGGTNSISRTGGGEAEGRPFFSIGDALRDPLAPSPGGETSGARPGGTARPSIVFRRPCRGGVRPFFSFSEGSSHGTVQVASLAEEVPTALAPSTGAEDGRGEPRPGNARDSREKPVTVPTMCGSI